MLVARYDDVKELSRSGGLEEINRVGGGNLSRFEQLCSGRAVWLDSPGSTGSDIGTFEHRGGSARTGTGEFLQFLSVASGSLAELETELILANRLGMLRAEETERLLEESETVSKMLGGLKRSLLSRRSQPPISL
jgi:hypothetical protein